VTDGSGGGLVLAAGLVSQPESKPASNKAIIKNGARTIRAASNTRQSQRVFRNIVVKASPFSVCSFCTSDHAIRNRRIDRQSGLLAVEVRDDNGPVLQARDLTFGSAGPA
jgi:hypothetical protein